MELQYPDNLINIALKGYYKILSTTAGGRGFYLDCIKQLNLKKKQNMFFLYVCVFIVPSHVLLLVPNIITFVTVTLTTLALVCANILLNWKAQQSITTAVTFRRRDNISTSCPWF